jgi:hypothetical protein
MPRSFCTDGSIATSSLSDIERVGAEHVSGAENGAERAENIVSGSGAVSETFEKREERERSAEREIGERERSGERVIIK